MGLHVGRFFADAQFERISACAERAGQDGQRVLQVIRHPENVGREDARRYFRQLNIEADDADQVWHFVRGLLARRAFIQRAQ